MVFGIGGQRIHVDGRVWSGSGVVEERKAIVAVEKDRNGVDLEKDNGTKKHIEIMQ